MLNPNIEFDVDQIAWIGFYRAGISRYSPSDVIICSAKETKSFAVKLNFLYVRTTRSITCLSGRILRRMLIILALAGLVLGDLAWLTGHEPLA